MEVLTRRQREIFNFLRDNSDRFAYPPSLDQLCAALGMASRGSLYKHIMALIKAGLVEPFRGNKQGGVFALALKHRVMMPQLNRACLLSEQSPPVSRLKH